MSLKTPPRRPLAVGASIRDLLDDYAALYKVAPHSVADWLLELGGMHLACFLAYGTGWVPEFFNHDERQRALALMRVIRDRMHYPPDSAEVRRQALRVIPGGRANAPRTRKECA